MDVQPPDKRTIFECALDFASGAEREAYLEDACAGKPEMRAQVDSLLKAHNDVGSFLDGPAFDAQRTAPMEPISEQPGTIIGPYKLLEQIGEGGFGVVFMAEQERPIRRRVAVKVIKPGMDTRQVIARFEAERQALALMDHPNIAHVLDAGATDSGRPYFVMELVRGVPITEFCDHHRLAVDERLKLFATVCHAVQHAHQKGIIHRDIKPTNVLVTLHDGEPVAKVIDFGVAKATGQRLTDKTLFTAFAQMIGTPLYMSPEQTEMSGLDVDTRSDIYSLGVVLYELLTGTTPFDKERLQQAAYDEMRRIIREEEPPKPSTRISTLGATGTSISTQRKSDPGKLGSLVRGELDWIVMKCLEKDRNRRYETPNGLAMDVQRYLAGEAVVAAPASAAYRTRKFVRRHRTPIIVTALLAIAALVGSGAYVSAIRSGQKRTESALQVANVERSRAEDAKHAAEQARLDTEIELQRARLVQVQLELATGDMAKARSLLMHPVDSSLEQEWHWRAWEYARKSRVVRRVDLNLKGEALAPARTAGHGSLGLVDGHLVAQVAPTSHKPFAVEVDTRLGRPFSGSPAKTLEPGFSAKSISPDDRYVASSVARGVVEIRDAENRGTLDNIPGAGENIFSLAFDPDGRRLHGLTGDWYVATWLWSASGPPDVDASDTQTEQTRRLKFTPDGRFLASDCYGGSVQVWDAKTHERVREIQGNVRRPAIAHLAGDASLTPDGQTLVTTASGDPIIHIWRVSDGLLAREIKTDPWTGVGVIRFILNSDGKNLYASGGGNAQARVELWNADAGTMTRRSGKLAEDAFIYGIALSEKHNRLFVCLHPSNQISDNPELRRCLILDASTLQTVGMLPDAHTGGLRDIDLSPDGKLLALCARDGTATIWDWQNQRLLHRLEAKPGRAHSNIISSVRFHPTQNVVATACHDNHLIFWSTDTGRPLADLNVDEQNKLGYGNAGVLKDIAFSPDGKMLVITVKDKLWWLDLTCYDDGVANLQAERDHPSKPAASTKASDSWAKAEKIYLRALALRNADHLNESTPEFSKAIELEPEHAPSWSARSWNYMAVGDFEKALADAQKVVQLDPGNSSSWADRAIVFERLKQHEKAVADFTKAIELDHRNAYWWQDRAHVLLGLKQYEKAIADFTQAIELDPGNEQFWRLRAKCWDALGQADKAAADRDKATALLTPVQRAQQCRQRAASYLSAGRNKEAAEELRRAIEIYRNAPVINNPGLAEGYNDVAWLLANCSDVKFRDPTQAVVLATKAVELNPKDSKYPNTLGTAYYRAGDWKAAIALLEKSMELRNGGDSFDWFFLAMAKWQLGEQDDAHQWYDKAAQWMQKNKPNDAQLIRFRSEAIGLLGVATFRKAVQVNGKDVNARLNLADALWGERKLGEATDEYREAVRLDPGNADARGQLALALNEQAWPFAVDSDPAKRDPRRAIKLAREAVELGPKVADYWNTLGVAEYRDGNWKDAISSLQKYRELRMNDAEWGNPFFLAMAHWQLGDKDNARRWYDKGIRKMDEHALTSESLIRFRSEAAELLGANEKK